MCIQVSLKHNTQGVVWGQQLEGSNFFIVIYKKKSPRKSLNLVKVSTDCVDSSLSKSQPPGVGWDHSGGGGGNCYIVTRKKLNNSQKTQKL